jgi:hypothetical protein
MQAKSSVGVPDEQAGPQAPTSTSAVAADSTVAS